MTVKYGKIYEFYPRSLKDTGYENGQKVEVDDITWVVGELVMDGLYVAQKLFKDDDGNDYIMIAVDTSFFRQR